MAARIFNFIGGETGAWRVFEMKAVSGEPLKTVSQIDVVEGDFDVLSEDKAWILRGATSYERYVSRAEKDALAARQPALNRSGAICAALIPVCKSPEWWNLAQDERRAILETKSKHIETGMKYLPAVARRLHHSRDLPGEEFDFLTWFEYALADAEKFEELVQFLRSSEEWKYVEREIDVRLVRDEDKANRLF